MKLLKYKDIIIIIFFFRVVIAMECCNRNKAACVKTIKLAIKCHLESDETNIEALRFVSYVEELKEKY